jgi:endonuclease G
MPSSVIIHAAYFAAGAVIGGGLVTAVSSGKKRQIPSPQFSVPTVDLRQSGVVIPPIVEIGASGDARITNAAAAMTLAPPVLKYGNPGL